MGLDYGALNEYVSGVMCKELPGIDIPGANRSHQHEFQGSGPLRHLLGDVERRSIPSRFLYLDDSGDTVCDAGSMSWYDSRKNQPRRGPEWRLYYSENEPIKHARVGDTLTLILLGDDTLVALITERDSSIDAQVKWLFGLDDDTRRIRNYIVGSNETLRVDATASNILEALGIDVRLPQSTEAMLDDMLRRFPDELPSTEVFSAYCRSTLGDVDYVHGNPDEIIYEAYQREEMLFRAYERHEAEETFPKYTNPVDVDGILSYSMSLFQRRKSRAGKSLEHSIEALLTARNIRHTAQAKTENHETPDFLFPSEDLYHDERFPAAGLTLLGAKTTCKDRWRQVLSEGKRVTGKHLVTLEGSISTRQTDDMRAKNLQLVVPTPLHCTYTEEQQRWLWDVGQFFDLVTAREREYAMYF
ncbi:restriction endonuclease [Olsenella sp. AM30-3LB]|uniref:type II restriction endonuclease n=1 Tax=Olsenella sp. AM30-3LB TaxID=2292359 RepID=UPI000E4F289F|nr:type II restriction endonuclease [Olsenella sp. AM30-3LB]RHD71610.1 restriction endonuclease [Olsenella sp. AM30-3LB]